MSASRVLRELSLLGVKVSPNGDRLHIEAPRDSLTDELKAELTRLKPELLAILSGERVGSNFRTARYDPKAAFRQFLEEHPRHFRSFLDKLAVRRYFQELPPPAPCGPVYCDELRQAASTKLQLLQKPTGGTQ